MSRSRRRHPVITEQQRHSVYVRWAKRQASKAARRACLPDGGAYRRVYSSWTICDYRFYAWSRWYMALWPMSDRRWWTK